ncbi:MAG TPA: VOC family protein [Bryobacteraceae bacterium]|nr:VOC family protein [Bryobacteraceae bacterium]
MSGLFSSVFGVVEVYRADTFLQVQIPGTRDVIVFEKNASTAGKSGGVIHFGFRLLNPSDIDAAVREVESAGGKILKHGEFCPGEPFLFAVDPDRYEVEIWHELPTRWIPPDAAVYTVNSRIIGNPSIGTATDRSSATLRVIQEQSGQNTFTTWRHTGLVTGSKRASCTRCAPASQIT